jgi:uncharacterized spore protein YtfJ
MTSTETQPLSAGANGIHPPPDTDAAVQRVVDQITTTAHVEVAFGAPRVIGERTLIPVAQVSYGFGGGSGGGSGSATGSDDAVQATSPGGFGSGVAGGLSVRPFALIAVQPDGVRVLPLLDVQSMLTRVFACAAVASILAVLIGQPRTTRRRLHVQIGRIDPQLWVGSQAFARPTSRGMLRRLWRR